MFLVSVILNLINMYWCIVNNTTTILKVLI